VLVISEGRTVGDLHLEQLPGTDEVAGDTGVRVARAGFAGTVVVHKNDRMRGGNDGRPPPPLVHQHLIQQTDGH
jgi:hypothetical protein